MKNIGFYVVFGMMTIIVFASILTAKQLPASGETDGYLAFAEQMPAPKGGIDAINKRIVYPAKAKAAGIEGKVYVLAFINESGGVDDVKVLKGPGAGCEEAVIDAVKASSFEAGRHQGQPVKVKLSLTFTFKLNF